MKAYSDHLGANSGNLNLHQKSADSIEASCVQEGHHGKRIDWDSIAVESMSKYTKQQVLEENPGFDHYEWTQYKQKYGDLKDNPKHFEHTKLDGTAGVCVPKGEAGVSTVKFQTISGIETRSQLGTSEGLTPEQWAQKQSLNASGLAGGVFAKDDDGKAAKMRKLLLAGSGVDVDAKSAPVGQKRGQSSKEPAPAQTPAKRARREDPSTPVPSLVPSEDGSDDEQASKAKVEPVPKAKGRAAAKVKGVPSPKPKAGAKREGPGRPEKDHVEATKVLFDSFLAAEQTDVAWWGSGGVTQKAEVERQRKKLEIKAEQVQTESGAEAAETCQTAEKLLRLVKGMLDNVQKHGSDTEGFRTGYDLLETERLLEPPALFDWSPHLTVARQSMDVLAADASTQFLTRLSQLEGSVQLALFSERLQQLLRGRDNRAVAEGVKRFFNTEGQYSLEHIDDEIADFFCAVVITQNLDEHSIFASRHELLQGAVALLQDDSNPLSKDN